MPISKTPSEELFQGYLSGDQTAVAVLRTDMEELARIAARKYAERATEAELVAIAMTYFDFALSKYAKHREEAKLLNKPLNKFSTYYAWWIQASIRTYLGIAEVPLKQIVPRS